MDSAPDDIRTRTGMAMGTLPFMAPEQALGKRSEIDGRVDIFAMGATAFRILARRRVHEADSDAGLLIAMATQPAPPLRSVVSDVPENVAAIIDLALAFNRDARYPDVRTMLNDVRAVRRGESPAFAFSQMRTRQEATRVGTNVAPLQYAAVAAPPVSGKPTVVAAPQATPGPTVVAAPQVAPGPTVVAAPQVTPGPTVVAAPQVAPGPTVVAAPPVSRQPTVVGPAQGQHIPTVVAAPAVLQAPSVVAQSAASHDSTPGGPQPSAGGSDQRSKRAAAFMAGSLLLIGGATWALWPASEPEVSDPSAAERNDMRTTTATRPAALRESAAEASESMSEQINKQQAKARERYQRAAGAAREQEKNERKREKRK
jgi:serine/threonine-protein kinase